MSVKTRATYADIAEDVEFILDTDRLATTRQVAARLGYRAHSGLTNALKAAGRDDLRDRLARNAALAGHHVTRRAS